MKNLKSIAMLVVVTALAAGLYWWWQNGKTFPSSDDSYLQAHILSIAPQIDGQVAQVQVQENQYFRTGDTLNTDELVAELNTA